MARLNPVQKLGRRLGGLVGGIGRKPARPAQVGNPEGTLATPRASNPTPFKSVVNQSIGAGGSGGGAGGSAWSDMPAAPDYYGYAQNGQLDPGFSSGGSAANLYAPGSAAAAMKDRATSTGDSPWLQLQLNKQNIEENALRGRAAQESLGAGAAAQSALAMRGGMGSGSRERIARDMGRNLNMARQGVAQQGMLGRVGLRTQDDASKMSALSSLTGEEGIMGRFNAQQDQQNQQFNVGNLIRDREGENNFKGNRYTQQMGGWAAGKTADAMRDSAAGGKSPWLFTPMKF